MADPGLAGEPFGTPPGNGTPPLRSLKLALALALALFCSQTKNSSSVILLSKSGNGKPSGAPGAPFEKDLAGRVGLLPIPDVFT